MHESLAPFTVAALYCFTPLDPQAVRADLRRVCEQEAIKGSLLLAPEGINGTVAGNRAAIDVLKGYIEALVGDARLMYKESFANEMPFHRLKVRLKREIVTLKRPEADPHQQVGEYVAPENWNALLARDDVVLIDTRNDYEYQIGTFEGAINPQTRCFSEFPQWWQHNKARFANKAVAMFCTGGIRCEKASSFLRHQGVQEVYHLEGGILQYLEDIPATDSHWHGDCYVFDGRVAVGHGLEESDYVPCHACGLPLSAEDCAHADFEEGVSCHHCIAETPEHRKTAFRMRHQQMLAQDKVRGKVRDKAWHNTRNGGTPKPNKLEFDQ